MNVLLALFIIGCGIAILETAANPYLSAILGDEKGASTRLNWALQLMVWQFYLLLLLVQNLFYLVLSIQRRIIKNACG